MDSFMGFAGPILQQLGFGGIMGFCAGYASKKVAKAMVVLIGILFICIQLLVYVKFVDVHWDKAAGAFDHAAQSGMVQRGFESCMGVLVHNLPFGASFVGGFWLGMKRG
jgi:uncharacterized membrane protein (Fun14 family)